jgi:hypothetical protein
MDFDWGSPRSWPVAHVAATTYPHNLLARIEAAEPRVGGPLDPGGLGAHRIRARPRPRGFRSCRPTGIEGAIS